MQDIPYNVVKNALLNMKIVVAHYNGKDRWLCPHVLGSKNGKYQCLFYQFEGGSERGLEPEGSGKNFRCLFLDQISIIRVEDGSWHSAPNYNPSTQTCVENVDHAVPAVA